MIELFVLTLHTQNETSVFRVDRNMIEMRK